MDKVATPKKRFSHVYVRLPCCVSTNLRMEPIKASFVSTSSQNRADTCTCKEVSACQIKSFKREYFLSDKYFLSKYFKREYLKQTSFRSKGALVQGLQALGRISFVTPESNSIIRIVFMISSKELY